MTVENIDLWVSAAGSEAPYYRFYADSSGTQELTEPTFDTNNTYTFYRLNEETSHPFYISDTGYKQTSSDAILITGDGIPSNGITGDQSLKVVFNESEGGVEDLLYYCSSHQTMQGYIVVNQNSTSLTTPSASELIPKSEKGFSVDISRLNLSYQDTAISPYYLDPPVSTAILIDNKLISVGRDDRYEISIIEADLSTGEITQHGLNLSEYLSINAIGDISNIVKLENGDYIVSGFTNAPVGSNPSGSDNGYTARIDANYDILWLDGFSPTNSHEHAVKTVVNQGAAITLYRGGGQLGLGGLLAAYDTDSGNLIWDYNC